MQTEWLPPLLGRVAEAAVAASGRVVGCTPDEVAALERRYDVVLPAQYKDVLLALGRRADGFLDRGEFDFYYDELLDLTDKVREQSRNRSDREAYPDLPPSTFVIRGRYLEQFELILCTGADTTPVLYFHVDTGLLVPAYPSIAAWFERICDDEVP